MAVLFLSCTVAIFFDLFIAGTPYEFNASPRINGVNFAESLGDWYFKRGKVSTQLMDSCHTVQCNPKCPSTPT